MPVLIDRPYEAVVIESRAQLVCRCLKGRLHIKCITFGSKPLNVVKSPAHRHLHNGGGLYLSRRRCHWRGFPSAVTITAWKYPGVSCYPSWESATFSRLVKRNNGHCGRTTNYDTVHHGSIFQHWRSTYRTSAVLFFSSPRVYAEHVVIAPTIQQWHYLLSRTPPYPSPVRANASPRRPRRRHYICSRFLGWN